MLNIHKRYRSGYYHEDIITERSLEFHTWNQTVEQVPNAITNNQISNRAIAIGNNPTRLGFDLTALKHASGLLGANTVQTYGCNALYRDFQPDFLVALGPDIVEEISKSNYIKDNIVYASATDLLEYPNKFYLIPYNPYADAGTTAAYIAAFDGHKKIYMLGYGEHDTDNVNFNVYAGTHGYDAYEADINSDKWIANRQKLFNVYFDVDFVWVTPHGRNLIPELLKYCPNFRQIDFRTFVLECDL